MDSRPTGVDYFDPQWSWPSSKFNLPLDDLFGNLYDQFNTIPIPIQEPIAFHHDVSELCSAASTLSEFYVLLKQRRDQRVEELRQCWEAVSLRIATWPPSLKGDEASLDERWAAFLHFSREFSFDTLNRYFSLFTHNKPSKSSALPPPSPGSPSQQSYNTNHLSTSKMSTAPIQTRKRRLSSSVTGSGDDQDSNECAQKPKRFRGAYNKPCAKSHASGGGTMEDNMGGTSTSHRGETTLVSTTVSVNSGSNPHVRRSGRIAARTQGPAQKADPRTKENLPAAESRRPRQLASTTKRNLRKAR